MPAEGGGNLLSMATVMHIASAAVIEEIQAKVRRMRRTVGDLRAKRHIAPALALERIADEEEARIRPFVSAPR